MSPLAFSRQPYHLMGLTFVLCAGLEFFPFDLIGLSHLSSQWGILTSSLLTPSLMVLALTLLMLRTPSDSLNHLRSHANFVLVSVMVALGLLASSIANQLPDPRLLPIAGNFLIGSIFLLMLVRAPSVSDGAFQIGLWLFAAWVITPLLLAPVDQEHHFFLACFPFTAFHGFTNGRLLFGFWSGCLAVMLAACQDREQNPWPIRIAFYLSYCALVACQTRSTIGLATLACGLLFFQTGKDIGQKALGMAVSFGVGLALHLLFNSYCHPFDAQEFRALDFRDPTRLQIYRQFIPDSLHTWLWGEGKMKLLSLPGIGEGVQAHNIFLQTLANFGVFTLLALLGWCWQLLRLFKTTAAKVLFVYFLGYSLVQPLFGGSLNYFAPRSLLVLMLIIYFDHALFNRNRRTP